MNIKSMTIAQLEEQSKVVLLKAKSITDGCIAAGRDFTPAERQEVDELMAQHHTLKAQAGERRESEAKTEALMDQLGKMRSLDDMTGGKLFRTSAPVQGGDWFKAYMDHQSRGDAKQLVTPSGFVGVPALASTIPAVGETVESVLQLVTTERLENSSVTYLREATRSHAAAPVAAGSVKPESEYELVEIDAPSEVIAHLSKPAPRQWFADAPNLQRYLDFVLRQGLLLALENQVLLGTGVRPQLQGMLTIEGRQFQLGDVDGLAACRCAITLHELANTPTSRLAYCFHPFDWENLELLDTGLGTYKMNDGDARAPINRQRRLLWGCPVAISGRMPQGTGLLFDRDAVRLYERQAVDLTWSENVYDGEAGKTDFERNLIRWRCEGRWAMAIFRPAGIVQIELTAGS